MLSDADILYSRMAGTIESLDFSQMDKDECLQLANCCEEACAGLCHCMNFLGESLAKLASYGEQEFTTVSLFKLSHSLTAISSLIPMLNDLEQLTRAYIREMETTTS